MSEICAELHQCLNELPHLIFPFDDKKIPKNGIYVLFEEGEKAHETNRIVRVGTHTGQDQLRSRLKQHFYKESKDRSIFRKNIGRAMLNRDNDPFLALWELDLMTRDARNLHEKEIDKKYLLKIERQVTEYMQSHFSFVVFEVLEKENRLRLESRLISTVSLCPSCRPSQDWLGKFSPKVKIRDSGLWIVNELNKQPFSPTEWKDFTKLLRCN